MCVHHKQVCLLGIVENSVFLTRGLSLTIQPSLQVMEGVKNDGDGKPKEVKIKGAPGNSLGACVAKAAEWTLEKANSTSLMGW